MPKYAQIKTPPNNEAAKKMPTEDQKLSIKNEVKFLHKKQKKKLNTQLFHIHINNASIWP
jgi:hypothetical protein